MRQDRADLRGTCQLSLSGGWSCPLPPCFRGSPDSQHQLVWLALPWLWILCIQVDLCAVACLEFPRNTMPFLFLFPKVDSRVATAPSPLFSLFFIVVTILLSHCNYFTTWLFSVERAYTTVISHLFLYVSTTDIRKEVYLRNFSDSPNSESRLFCGCNFLKWNSNFSF